VISALSSEKGAGMVVGMRAKVTTPLGEWDERVERSEEGELLWGRRRRAAGEDFCAEDEVGAGEVGGEVVVLVVG